MVKVEAGKVYKTRGGNVVRDVRLVTNSIGFPFLGMVSLHGNRLIAGTWREDGSFSDNPDSQLDIVEEVPGEEGVDFNLVLGEFGMLEVHRITSPDYYCAHYGGKPKRCLFSERDWSPSMNVPPQRCMGCPDSDTRKQEDAVPPYVSEALDNAENSGSLFSGVDTQSLLLGLIDRASLKEVPVLEEILRRVEDYTEFTYRVRVSQEEAKNYEYYRRMAEDRKNEIVQLEEKISSLKGEWDNLRGEAPVHISRRKVAL